MEGEEGLGANMVESQLQQAKGGEAQKKTEAWGYLYVDTD